MPYRHLTRLHRRQPSELMSRTQLAVSLIIIALLALPVLFFPVNRLGKQNQMLPPDMKGQFAGAQESLAERDDTKKKDAFGSTAAVYQSVDDKKIEQIVDLLDQRDISKAIHNANHLATELQQRNTRDARLAQLTLLQGEGYLLLRKPELCEESLKKAEIAGLYTSDNETEKAPSSSLWNREQSFKRCYGRA